MIASKQGYVEVRPQYKVKEETYNFQVYVDGVASEDVSVYDVTTGTVITITAPNIDGKKFLCWKNEQGEIVDYDVKLTLRASANRTLYATYGTETQKELPIVSITDSYTETVGTTKKVVFVATHSVPEGYRVVEHGVLRKTTGLITDENFRIGETDVKRYTSGDVTSKGTFALTTNVGTSVERFIYVRGYLILEDISTGEIITVYGNIKGASYNRLNNIE